MSRWTSYVSSAEQVINRYNGSVPLSHWLREYFKENKKMGSTDRKFVGSLVYQYYRTSGILSGENIIPASRFLCVNQADPVLAALTPQWDASLDLAAKKQLLSDEGYVLKDGFSWKDFLSTQIETKEFLNSFLIQPDVFLRIRPGFRDTVISKLQAAGLEFSTIGEDAIVVANQTQASEVIDIDREAVVQDYSSQRTGGYFGLKTNGLRVWDCCAASGGKSIMAWDMNPSINLTVSDIRESILANLKRRFFRAGIKEYYSFQADLSATGNLPTQIYDTVIADLPCTGSGTWSRTPEQAYFFAPEKIAHYSGLQKSILRNIAKTLKPGGRLIYITCSVFAAENEEVVEFALANTKLKLVDQQYFKGYDRKADTLFAALFRT